MDAKDHFAAAKALRHWFISQDIGVEDASVVISVYMAAIVVAMARTRADLDKGISAFLKDFRDLTEEGFSRK